MATQEEIERLRKVYDEAMEAYAKSAIEYAKAKKAVTDAYEAYVNALKQKG